MKQKKRQQIKGKILIANIFMPNRFINNNNEENNLT